VWSKAPKAARSRRQRRRGEGEWGKGKGKGLDTCHNAAYMSQTRDQQRFTISEVAADWHEPMVPQRIMRLSIARANGHIGPTVQLADTPSPQSATLCLHPVAVTYFPSRRG